MKRCLDCGGPMNRGSTAPRPRALYCLVCQVARSLRDWKPAPMKGKKVSA